MSARMFNNYQHRCLNCFESRTDLSEAIKETKAASQYVIQNKRNNMVWDALYTSTVQFFTSIEAANTTKCSSLTLAPLL